MELIRESIAALPLQHPDGREITFGSLWADRPAVVVFLRHFG